MIGHVVVRGEGDVGCAPDLDIGAGVEQRRGQIEAVDIAVIGIGGGARRGIDREASTVLYHVEPDRLDTRENVIPAIPGKGGLFVD